MTTMPAKSSSGKGIAIFFLIIVIVIIIAVIAWTHDTNTMNEMLERGCVQVANVGSQQTWECP